MLVFNLCKIRFLKYKPVPELVELEFKGGSDRDGIWDLLGFYTSSSRTVHICDLKIKEEVEKPLHYGVLRELVRLHEHSHALLHNSSIHEIISNLNGLFIEHVSHSQNDWYAKLPPKVDEPLTEFIAYVMIKDFKNDLFLKIFKEVDNKTPSYYQRWKELTDIVGKGFIKPWIIPFIIDFAGSRNWNDFDEFCHCIKKFLKEGKNLLKFVSLILDL